ncbi:MAG: hypothetical protein M3443_16265 [Actinomycetota bacterium]|nr:hypothetical protein [Actinomycetota bacterium]
MLAKFSGENMFAHRNSNHSCLGRHTEGHGDLNALLVKAAELPFIARNTRLTRESSFPKVLTMNRPMFHTNRAAACPQSFPRHIVDNAMNIA